MGFGAEIGVWVWCGDRRWAVGLSWVAWVWIDVGFSWWLSAWVSSKVVGVGFGGWNGGGMVVGTVIG